MEEKRKRLEVIVLIGWCWNAGWTGRDRGRTYTADVAEEEILWRTTQWERKRDRTTKESVYVCARSPLLYSFFLSSSIDCNDLGIFFCSCQVALEFSRRFGWSKKKQGDARENERAHRHIQTSNGLSICKVRSTSLCSFLLVFARWYP